MNTKHETGSNSTQKMRRTAFEWLETVVVSVLLVVFVFTFIFRVVGITGDSMLNTLHDSERVIISNFFYQPKYGDIVVISRNYTNDPELTSYDYSSPIIKRVIATEGQTVDIDFEAGIVYVDGVALDEPYTKTTTNVTGDIPFPVEVPENCIFVLGDNRNESLDSRYSSIGNYGMVDTRYVLGKALIRVFPFDKIGGLYGE